MEKRVFLGAGLGYGAGMTGLQSLLEHSYKAALSQCIPVLCVRNK